MNFNHKFGCLKCCTIGEYDNDAHVMCFPDIKAERRTDETFRSRAQQQHHHMKSPLEDLDIDMIYTFPSSDPLHLLELGVMKKCLLRWIGKTKHFKGKWKKNTIESVSQYLLQCNEFMPTDIHRALRSLDVLSYWKGVEFRTLLLYVGMVALRPALATTEYEHFLTLCCACTICSCEIYKLFIPMAKTLFDLDIEGYIQIYGKNTIGSNVHNLCHITEDMVQNDIGNLMKISTYKYENTLRLLGMKLQSCNKPLEQIARRLIEISKLNAIATDNSELHGDKFIYEEDEFVPYAEYKLSDAGGYQMHSKINIKRDIFLSSRKKGDQWFLTRSGDIAKMNHCIQINRAYKVCGFVIKNKCNYFTAPLQSSKLNIFMSDGEVHGDLCMFDLKSIAAKMMCLPFETNFVFIPLLHTLESLNE